MSLEIESGKSYSGETVKALLDAVESAARDKITAAFAQGYKQGLLDSYPDVAYWQSLSKNMSDAAKKSAPGWGVVIGVAGVAVVVGVASGLLLGAYALR